MQARQRKTQNRVSKRYSDWLVSSSDELPLVAPPPQPKQHHRIPLAGVSYKAITAKNLAQSTATTSTSSGHTSVSSISPLTETSVKDFMRTTMKELVGSALSSAIETHSQAAEMEQQASNQKILDLEVKIAAVDSKIDNFQSQSTQAIIEGIKSDSAFVSNELFNHRFAALEQLIINQSRPDPSSPDRKRRNVTPNKTDNDIDTDLPMDEPASSAS